MLLVYPRVTLYLHSPVRPTHPTRPVFDLRDPFQPVPVSVGMGFDGYGYGLALSDLGVTHGNH